MRRLMLLIVLLATSVPSWAEVVLPSDLARRILRTPEPAIRAGAALILAQGRDGVLFRDGIERAIAVDRARARAQAVERLMRVDLDADGVVSGEELRIALDSLPLSLRGRSQLAFASADVDGNGRATPAEIADAADDAAQAAVTPDEVAGMLGLLAFDTDADGGVSLAEVEVGVLAWRAAEREARGLKADRFDALWGDVATFASRRGAI